MLFWKLTKRLRTTLGFFLPLTSLLVINERITGQILDCVFLATTPPFSHMQVHFFYNGSMGSARLRGTGSSKSCFNYQRWSTFGGQIQSLLISAEVFFH